MSGLAKDAAAFKSTLHRQDYTSWHSQPKPLNPESSSTSSPGAGLAVAGEESSPSSNKKGKRPKTSMLLIAFFAFYVGLVGNLS